MFKPGTLLDILNSLAGRRGRHNKALRGVTEWAGKIQEFLTVYELYGSSNFNLLLEDLGKAKFDLTFIAYKGRLLIRTTRDIRGQQIYPLMSEIVTGVEDLRRVLANFSLQSEKASEVILNLRKSYEKLQDTLSDMA